jgi:hypothetical protein
MLADRPGRRLRELGPRPPGGGWGDRAAALRGASDFGFAPQHAILWVPKRPSPFR